MKQLTFGNMALIAGVLILALCALVSISDRDRTIQWDQLRYFGPRSIYMVVPAIAAALMLASRRHTVVAPQAWREAVHRCDVVQTKRYAMQAMGR